MERKARPGLLAFPTVAVTPGERIEATPFAIPFRTPFATSKITHRMRHGIIVRLHTPDGIGIGEASPPPSLGVAAVLEALVLIRHEAVALPPWIRFGLDTARLDLEGRANGQSIAARIGAGRTEVAVNATIGSADPKQVAQDALEARAAGFSTVKVKVAIGSLADDVARIARLRDAVGPELRIRVDANQGWNEAEAIAALARLAEYDIDYVEQPVASNEAMARVRRASSIRIAADEAVTDPAATQKLIDAGAADVFIVKPARVGGFEPARAIASLVTAAGLTVVITSTLDTSVGVAAALHIAASLEQPPLACGLATASLLAGDVVREPLAARNGFIQVPSPGLGLVLSDDELTRWQPT